MHLHQVLQILALIVLSIAIVNFGLCSIGMILDAIGFEPRRVARALAIAVEQQYLIDGLHAQLSQIRKAEAAPTPTPEPDADLAAAA